MYLAFRNKESLKGSHATILGSEMGLGLALLLGCITMLKSAVLTVSDKQHQIVFSLLCLLHEKSAKIACPNSTECF